MDYFSPRTAHVSSVAFRSASVASNGVWLRLHGFCSVQESGGRIVGCKVWTDQQWAAAIACKKVQVEHAVREGMGEYEGDDLLLRWYDIEGENLFRGSRKRNKENAEIGWEKRRAAMRAASEKAGGKDASGTAHDGKSDATRNASGNAYVCMDGSMDGGRPVRPAQATPLPFSNGQKNDSDNWIATMLADHGLPNHSSAVADWHVYLFGDVKATTSRECQAFLRWIIPLGKSKGVAIEYPRHAGDAAARSWRETERARFFPPIHQVAK